MKKVEISGAKRKKMLHTRGMINYSRRLRGATRLTKQINEE